MSKKFFGSSPFDQDVEKATSELNISEDWQTILKIIDTIKENPSKSKDCFRSILKRLNSNVPHHALQALTLLDACVKNCDRDFLLEVSSRDFEIAVLKLLNKAHPKVIDKLKQLMKTWEVEVFKDPEFSLMQTLIKSVVKDLGDDIANSRAKDDTAVRSQAKEDEDIQKAIELSLKETSQSSSLYPSASALNSTNVSKTKQPRKVLALYDFQKAEDNELSFKAGDEILVTDDSDSNWWHGQIGSQTGLFPANFVTADLTSAKEASSPIVTKSRKVTFNEEVKVEEPKVAEIDEKQIDKVLMLLHEADPRADFDSEEEEVVENCLLMQSAINQKLVNIDRLIAQLATLNNSLMGALNMYEQLMKAPVHTHDSYQPHAAVPQEVFRGTYNAPEAYQPVPAPPGHEHYASVHSAGPIQPHPQMMPPSGHPYVANQNAYPYMNIPQSVPMPASNFSTPVSSNDQNIMFYNNVAMPPQNPPNAVPLQHNPMS